MVNAALMVNNSGASKKQTQNKPTNVSHFLSLSVTDPRGDISVASLRVNPLFIMEMRQEGGLHTVP